MILQRVIGEYTEGRPGPLLICLGALHGNEPAGVKAMELMMKMLEVEPITNDAFEFKGAVVGIIGNLSAYIVNQRFIKQDLNRSWHKKDIDRILATPIDDLRHEEFELRVVHDLIMEKIEEYNPESIVVLDLHTTSSDGGIFSIPNDESKSKKLARMLNAPVIQQMMKGIHGTTLNYFTKDNFDLDITAVAFESGQHNDPTSINRAIAGITNMLAAAGNIDKTHIANRHNLILDEYSDGLPRVTNLIDKYHIDDIDKFEMMPGYQNFQPVQKGEQLATYDGVPVLASNDGLILMPLYQEQGEDGFFLVQEVLEEHLVD